MNSVWNCLGCRHKSCIRHNERCGEVLHCHNRRDSFDFCHRQVGQILVADLHPCGGRCEDVGFILYIHGDELSAVLHTIIKRCDRNAYGSLASMNRHGFRNDDFILILGIHPQANGQILRQCGIVGENKISGGIKTLLHRRRIGLERESGAVVVDDVNRGMDHIAV